MKILFFSGVPINDAALIHRAGLLAKLLEQDRQEIVFTSVSGDFAGVIVKKINGLSVEFIGQAHYQAKMTFLNRKNLSLLRVIKESFNTGWRLVKIIRRERPDKILIFTAMPSSLIAGLAAKLFRIKTYLDIDDLSVGQMSASKYPKRLIGIYNFLEIDWINFFFQKISVCSHFLQDKYPESVLIPNMIDVDYWKSGDSAERRKLNQIVFLGHINQYQGQEEILKELELDLLQKKIKIIFVGSGQNFNKLKQKVTRIRLTEQVKLTGQISRERVRKILHESSIGLLPLWDKPVHEARHPLKLIEYLAAGLVVVTNAVGEAKLIIKDGENGLLLPAGDMKNFPKAIGKIINDPQKMKKISANAVKTASQFSTEKILPKWQKFLQI